MLQDMSIKLCITSLWLVAQEQSLFIFACLFSNCHSNVTPQSICVYTILVKGCGCLREVVYDFLYLLIFFLFPHPPFLVRVIQLSENADLSESPHAQLQCAAGSQQYPFTSRAHTFHCANTHFHTNTHHCDENVCPRSIVWLLQNRGLSFQIRLQVKPC